ncbi:MAG: hypothetical protein NZ890_19255, partial [Myxococcota bacterium]|nr:hypothetical protein [Myxococcota bacterium]
IELIFAVRDARKRPVRELRPGVHPHLEVIVDRAMARSRSQRFQSAEEVAQSLEAFLQQVYPSYRRSTFGRYLRSVFAREIDRELRQLEEYVIEGGNPNEVGENLLADVLGPNAPYTQFTAAFVEEMRQTPQRTAAAHQQDESLMELPSESGGPINQLLAEQQTGPQQLPRIPRNEGDLRRQIDAGWGPLPSPLAPPDVQAQRLSASPPTESVLADWGADARLDLEPQGLHDEQTRILTRVQLSVQHPELHDAQTRLFDFRSLPRHQQEKLRGAPAQLELVGDELHEANTVFLPRASLRGPVVSDGGLRLPGTQLPPPSPGDVRNFDNSPTVVRPDLHLSTGADGGPPTFSNQPTQPGGGPAAASRIQTGSIELKSGDVSFLSPAHTRPEATEPSVVLDEDDLEAVE